MKGKILQALKTKYSKFGFGEKAFNGVADILVKTVTEESQIENAVSGVEEYLKIFQGEQDSIRAEKSNLQKELDELKKKNNPDPNPKDEEVPAWAKALIDANKSLNDKLASIEGEKTQLGFSKTATERLNESKVPASFYNVALSGKQFKTEDEVTAFVNEMEQGYTALKQELSNAGFSQTTPPEEANQPEKNSTELANLINLGTKEIIESKK